jgi:DNA-binding CsgD family transcriptional regulator
MAAAKVDSEALLRTSARLGDAVVDPRVWPEILSEISCAVGAVGAALLQSDIRTPDIPRTDAVDEVFDRYFKEGWHTRDIRAERGVPLLLGGQRVVIDQDIMTQDEIRRSDYYQDLLAPSSLGWWAVIGFRAGLAHWGLSIQRSIQQGPFAEDDRRALAQIANRLTETATLSTVVGRTVLSGMTNALGLLKQPAVALDRSGLVLDFNAAAERMFDDDIRVRNRYLELSDRQARVSVDMFIQRLRAVDDEAALSIAPIVVRRSSKRPLLLRALPVDGAARSPFVGSSALLLFSDLQSGAGLSVSLLSQVFGLSPAEAKLAAALADGLSPEQAARKLGIAKATARSQLKSVFSKTETHRQGELVAVLSRLT